MLAKSKSKPKSKLNSYLIAVILLLTTSCFDNVDSDSLNATSDSGIKLQNTIKAHSDTISSVVFSPDGKTVISGSWDKTIKIWDVTTGILIKTINSPATVRSLALSPDSKILASYGGDAIVRLWNIETGEQTATLIMGGSLSVSSYTIAFSANGQTLAISNSSFHDTVKLWNIENNESKVIVEDNGVVSIAFSPNGNTLAIGGFFWNTKTGSNSQIKLWNIKTDAQIIALGGHSEVVISIAYSPDGKILASGSQDKIIQLWNTKTNKLIVTLKGTSKAESIAFSPDGKILASDVLDNEVTVDFEPLENQRTNKLIELWNTKNGKLITTLEGNSYYAKAIAFSPDGKTLASGGSGGLFDDDMDHFVELWQIPQK